MPTHSWQTRITCTQAPLHNIGRILSILGYIKKRTIKFKISADKSVAPSLNYWAKNTEFLILGRGLGSLYLCLMYPHLRISDILNTALLQLQQQGLTFKKRCWNINSECCPFMSSWTSKQPESMRPGDQESDHGTGLSCHLFSSIVTFSLLTFLRLRNNHYNTLPWGWSHYFRYELDLCT